MPTVHLTDKAIKAIKPSAKRVEYYDDNLIKDEKLKIAGAKGLGLRISPGGRKTFFYTYWHAGSSRRITIGTYPNISLKHAREKAIDYAKSVAEGEDPNRLRKKAKEERPITLKEYADLFEKEYVVRKLKPSTQRDYKSRLNKIRGSHKIANMPLVDLKREQIRAFLKYESIDNPVNANRVHSVLSKLLNEAQEDQIIQENPMKGMQKVTKEQSRDVRYTNDDIKAIWSALEEEHLSMRCLIRMLLITGQRLGETSRMKWSDVDMDEQLWSIPKAETKSNRPHIVPLSEIAMEILLKMKDVYPDAEFVFPGMVKKMKPWSYFKGVTDRIRTAAKLTSFRIHDLRHIVATGMIDLGIEFIHVGKVLNHKSLAGENAITARYTNNEFTDQKRRALERWAYRVEQIVFGKQSKIAGRIGA